MRYGVAIPHANRFASGSALNRMAAVVEDLGFDSIWTSDHIIVPEGSSYIPEVMLEPLATLSHLAARTSHVTLGVSVLVVPYRDPVFTAKYLSSLDVISGGRLVLGVGIGWLGFRHSFVRGKGCADEYWRFRDLWETETSSYDGKWKQYDSMRMFPKAAPERRGTIPIWVGGNTGPAHRRAAKLGDGWHPINMSPSELGAGVVAYKAACADAGRSPGPVCLRHMPGRPGTEERAVLTGTPDEQAGDIRPTPRQASTSSCSMPWRSLDDLATSLARSRESSPGVAVAAVEPQPGRIVRLMRGPTSVAGDTFGTE
jgi:probable F420-dependent oxidoreductase